MQLHFSKFFLILSFIFCGNSFASETYIHDYIFKPQLDIKEKYSSLFDENNKCKYTFNDIHFHPRNFSMKGDTLEKIYDESEKNCVGKILANSLPLLKHWAPGTKDRPTRFNDDQLEFYWNTISDIPTFEEYRKLSAQKKSKFIFLINGFMHFDMGAIEAVNSTIELYKDLPIVGFGEIFGKHDIIGDQMNPKSRIDSPALDKIYDLAAKKNWFVLIHNNLAPRSFKGAIDPVYLEDMKKVLKQHSRTTFILAHAGIMRNIVVDNLTKILDETLRKNKNLYIDISFVVLENYIMNDSTVSHDWIALIEKYPNRFLFGTDNLGSYQQFTDVKKYIPLLNALKTDTAKN